MKKYILLGFIIFAYYEFAQAKSSENFHLGEVLQNEDKLAVFLDQNLGAKDISSRAEIQKDWGEQSSLFKKPLIAEFTYQTLQAPKAIAALLKVFVDKKKFIIFSLGIIFTLILSHYLGEFKFKFKILSWQRMLYSGARLLSINALRVWLFVIIFGENTKPLFKIYMSSLENTAEYQPLLYQVSSTLTSLM